MVVRPRRAVPGDGLIILICAISGHILGKTLNGLVLLSSCLWYLWPLTLS
jgi:hypothetical protein